jgi:hypothetical protein
MTPNKHLQPTAASVACGTLGAFRASAAAEVRRYVPFAGGGWLWQN